MRKSLGYLPKDKQEELKTIVKRILERLHCCELVILYGDYVRKVNFKNNAANIVPETSFSRKSNYDILVVTSGMADKDAGRILDQVIDKYYRRPSKQTPVEFINDDIHKFNNSLSEGQFFHTVVKQEGILLYNSGKYKLVRRRKLDYQKIRQQAQKHFDDKFHKGTLFLHNAAFNFVIREYAMAAFMLHQACENFYDTIRLVFTLRNNKQHNLAKLSSSTRKYSEELHMVFPLDTPGEKRLFTLLKNAYVDGRYNPQFEAAKEDIETLIPKAELLRDITNRICRRRIASYDAN